MKATQILLSKGFLGRSMDELRRRTSIAMKLEAVKGAQGPKPLYEFNTQDDVCKCIVMTDKTIGGFSESKFDYISSSPTDAPPTANATKPSSIRAPPSYARFHGHISTRLPPDRPNIERTGFAGFRTPDQLPTAFGRSVWDIDPYLYLAMRVKSDGRAYFINLQTESVEPSDLHQHRLFAKRPGEWETVLIKWNDFVRTNHGFVVEPQTEMLRQKVTSVGIGLTDRREGPFELCVERVWATNDLSDADAVESIEESGSQLRNRKGEKVRW
ncbi:Fc.00g036530.m01.CDS01 [Cosmosporella sp. VM-42]